MSTIRDRLLKFAGYGDPLGSDTEAAPRPRLSRGFAGLNGAPAAAPPPAAEPTPPPTSGQLGGGTAGGLSGGLSNSRPSLLAGGLSGPRPVNVDGENDPINIKGRVSMFSGGAEGIKPLAGPQDLAALSAQTAAAKPTPIKIPVNSYVGGADKVQQVPGGFNQNTMNQVAAAANPSRIQVPVGWYAGGKNVQEIPKPGGTPAIAQAVAAKGDEGATQIAGNPAGPQAVAARAVHRPQRQAPAPQRGAPSGAGGAAPRALMTGDMGPHGNGTYDLPTRPSPRAATPTAGPAGPAGPAPTPAPNVQRAAATLQGSPLAAPITSWGSNPLLAPRQAAVVPAGPAAPPPPQAARAPMRSLTGQSMQSLMGAPAQAAPVHDMIHPGSFQNVQQQRILSASRAVGGTAPTPQAVAAKAVPARPAPVQPVAQPAPPQAPRRLNAAGTNLVGIPGQS